MTPGAEDYQEFTETPRAALLLEALNLVESDRNKDYGSPWDDFQRTARMWNAMWGGKADGTPFMPWDVAVALICVKLSRIQESLDKKDHWADIAGYAACGWDTIKESTCGSS